MDYKQIAGILDIPAGSVATALHRGRERLAGRLLNLKEKP
jgi:DNA-directed RNA polymerase specialized sigma24 family protein